MITGNIIFHYNQNEELGKLDRITREIASELDIPHHCGAQLMNMGTVEQQIMHIRTVEHQLMNIGTVEQQIMHIRTVEHQITNIGTAEH